MKKLYLLVFGQNIEREELTSFLSSVHDCGPWFYSIPNSVFVYSLLNAEELYACVAKHFHEHGNMFVTEVPYHNSQGWIPDRHWEIIKRNVVVHDYDLEFRGYWLENNEKSLPEESGIYCVYASTYNREIKTVSLNKLLYIGQSVNVCERHREHEGKIFWKSKLKEGEGLCYSFAPLPKRSLAICEMALIYKHKPICNTMGKESFPYEATHIVTRGRNACLIKDFTVFHSEG